MPTPLEAHEEICTLRYEMLCARIKRLESILIKACGAMLVGMASCLGRATRWRIDVIAQCA